MQIDTPVRRLGHVDCRGLTERVLAAEEGAWHSDSRRQDDYEVHAETQSIILSFCTGWPKVRVNRTAAWDDFADLAVPVMQELIARHYPAGGLVLRAIFARLPAGCRIARHRDAHPSFAVGHRIHVPLVTNPDVDFIVGNERIEPQAHQAFELNNALSHEVRNNGGEARIHFVFDYAPT